MYKNFLTDKTLVCFIAFAPFFMYVDRGLFNILLAFLLIFFIFLYKKNILSLKNENFLKAISIFLILLPLIDIVSTKTIPFSNILNALMVIVFFFIIQAIFFHSKNKQVNIKIFLKTLFYTMSFIAVILIVSWLIDVNLLLSVKKTEIIPFNHNSFHSSHTFLVAGLGLYLYFFIKEKKSLLNILCIIALFTSAYISQGRTAILTMSVGFLIFTYVYFLKNSRKTIKILAITILMMISIFSISYISSGDGLAVGKIHTSGRFDGYVKYVEYTLEHAPLFGLGINGGEKLYKMKIIPYKHPHNIFIEALVATGVVGVLLLISLLSYIFYLFLKAYLRATITIDKALLASSFCMFIISSQGFWSIWNKHHLMIMFLYLFMAFFIAKASKQAVD
ncbi:MAG: O-antigen ligase family protein [Sulfurospirillaceae bacterium]|nr:O-antigen ligase family protein [Sulfurospirillaceae bacterium]